jgi:hypothetical protein
MLALLASFMFTMRWHFLHFHGRNWAIAFFAKWSESPIPLVLFNIYEMMGLLGGGCDAQHVYGGGWMDERWI